jgi:hypothetical protein
MRKVICAWSCSMSGDRGKLIQQHGWVVTGTLVTESTYIMIRQCWVTVRVRVRAFVCVYSCTPRHTQCCGRGHAARNLHSTYYIYFTHTHAHVHTCKMRIPQSILIEYVPSPKVYEVCFYKRTINSIITCAHARAHTHTHTLAHTHIDKRPHTHIHSLSFPRACERVCVRAHTHAHTLTQAYIIHTNVRDVVCSV